jgi:transcriptional regulator GlxA family with amidase domain
LDVHRHGPHDQSGATSVTDVATRWGFFHLGRFAQAYGQLYGERPSQTLRTLPPKDAAAPGP